MSELLVLERTYYQNATIGRFRIADQHLCFALELPWRDNRENESCIPEGTYEIGRHDGSQWKDTVALVNTDLGVSHGKEEGIARFGICVHPANYPTEIDGCIAPGTSVGYAFENWCVWNSGEAMKHLKPVLFNHDEIRITAAPGPALDF